MRQTCPVCGSGALKRKPGAVTELRALLGKNADSIMGPARAKPGEGKPERTPRRCGFCGKMGVSDDPSRADSATRPMGDDIHHIQPGRSKKEHS